MWFIPSNIAIEVLKRVLSFDLDTKGHCTQSSKFSPLKNKYDLTLCQSRLHTASKTFVRHKIRIRLDFLRFHIRSKHFDRKGWRIRKNSDSVCKDLKFIQILVILILKISLILALWSLQHGTLGLALWSMTHLMSHLTRPLPAGLRGHMQEAKEGNAWWEW